MADVEMLETRIKRLEEQVDFDFNLFVERSIQKLAARVGRLEKGYVDYDGKQERKELDVFEKKPGGVRKYPYINPKDIEEGVLIFAGNYKIDDGSGKSCFASQRSNIKGVLNVDSFEMSKIMNAFASEERVNIIKALMTKKMTAKEIMDELGFTTTGKLYHHLSALEKLHVIFKEQDYYIIDSRYIGCIALLFTAAEQILRKQSY